MDTKEIATALNEPNRYRQKSKKKISTATIYQIQSITPDTHPLIKGKCLKYIIYNTWTKETITGYTTVAKQTLKKILTDKLNKLNIINNLADSWWPINN